MKIYIICPVRLADDKMRAKLEAYANWLEDEGHTVHLPHRDTDQSSSEFEICMENGKATMEADEVHVVYDKRSTGIHFDLGMLFVKDMLLGKKTRIRPITGLDIPEGKSFKSMINKWVHEQNQVENLYPFPKEALELDFKIPFEDF